MFCGNLEEFLSFVLNDFLKEHGLPAFIYLNIK
jgi:hypothetical protein